MRAACQKPLFQKVLPVRGEGKIDIIQCELILDNNYNKYLNFYDIEKYLVPNKYRLVATYPGNQNLFEGETYCIETLYFKKTLIK